MRHALLAAAALLLAAGVAAPALARPAAAPPAPAPQQAPAPQTAAAPQSQPAAPASVFDQAIAQVSQGDLAGAVARLEPLRGQQGADPRALALLGTLYVETGRPQDGLAVLAPLADQEGANPAVLFNAARAAQAAGQDDKAEQYLTRSVAADPVSPAGRALGMVRAVQGRPAEAFELLYPWTRANPDDTAARLAAAQAAVRIGKVSETQELLGGLDANSPGVRVIEADLALLQGNAAAALDKLGPLLASPPPDLDVRVRVLAADAYLLRDQPDRAEAILAGHAEGRPRPSLLLARALRQQGKTAAALATLEPLARELLAAKAEGPMPPVAIAIVVDYGRYLAAAGRGAEGLEALRKLTAVDPTSAAAWQGLAEFLRGQGKAGEAKEADAKATRLADAESALGGTGLQIPRGDAHSADLAAIFDLLTHDKPQEALDLARRESARVPADPRPQLLSVRILLSMDRKQEALAAAEATAQAFPDLADAVYQLGVMRMATGDTAAAEQQFRRALELAPDHTPTMNDLAVLLMDRGQRAEAKELLERVLALQPGDQLAGENLHKLEEEERGGSS
jgi:predicted Zn-dependent protease